MRKFFFAAILAVTSFVAGSTSADAAFRIRVSSTIGGTLVDVTDNGAGDVLNTTNGVILVSSVSGGATINVNVASSKPAIGSAARPELALGFNVIQMGTGLAQTITIEVTDTDFTPVTAEPLVSEIGGTLVEGRSTVTDNSYIGVTNTEFDTTGTGALTTQLGTFTTPNAFSGSATFGPSTTQPYSLTKVLTIVIGAGNGNGFDTSGNAKITTVPAPAGALLLMTALPALGLGTWIRRRRVTTVA